jgi:hypothetical protein
MFALKGPTFDVRLDFDPEDLGRVLSCSYTAMMARRIE